MENSKPFYDLCINENVKNDFGPFVKKCVELGYKTIAIDHVLDVSGDISTSGKQKKGSKKSEEEIIREPIDVQNLLKQADCQDIDLKILLRLTVISDDKDATFKVMKTNTFKKYDIFALLPKTTDAFQHACHVLEADLITFDPLDVKNVKITRRMYNRAISRGLHFELMYYHAIVDQSMRRNIITRSHTYHQVGKSKNIIITSSCNSAFTLRAPYDVINLALIFGLNEQQAKLCVASSCEDVIKHAIGRRIGNAIIYIGSVNSDTNEKMEVDCDENVEPVQKKIKI